MEEIKIAYVHVPTFFNAHTVQKENKIEDLKKQFNELYGKKVKENETTEQTQ